VAPILSQNNMGAVGRETPSSLSKDWSQHKSAAVLAKALYSNSVLERETVGCFLELQERSLLLMKMQKPDVDLLSSGQPAQSASKNANDGVNNCRVYFVFNKGFSQFVKYLVIRKVYVIFMSNSIRGGG